MSALSKRRAASLAALVAAVAYPVGHDRPSAFAQAPPPALAASASIEQTAPGQRPALTAVASFDGIGAALYAGNVPPRNPSDNSLAVGPEHVMQTVNSQAAVFTKAGRVVYGPIGTHAFFTGYGEVCGSRANGDAVVRYDQLADRWLVVMPIFRRAVVRAGAGSTVANAATAPPGIAARLGQASHPGAAMRPGPPPAAPTPGGPPSPPDAIYAVCYAVSATADPLGPYHRYVFERELFPDYPRPAVWPDGYYLSTSTGDDVIEKHVCVVDRVKMLAGLPATEQCVVVDGVNFLNTADLDGTTLPPVGAPNLVMATGGTQLLDDIDDDGIYAWRMFVDWARPSNTRLEGPRKIVVAPYRYLCGGQLTNCVPQPGVERRLDAQGDKIMARLVYRNLGTHQSLVAVHSVDTAAGGGGVRWYEFRLDDNGDPGLHQQSTYAPDGAYRWMASPAIDRAGNIAIGYSFGSATHFPGQRFSARLANDPKGLLTFRESVLAGGEAAQTTTLRWEDYTQTAMDTTDDCTIWYVGNYLKTGATTYSTRIGAFRVPTCTP